MKEIKDFINVKNIEEFQVDPQKVKYIDGGWFGDLYQISENEVVKILIRDLKYKGKLTKDRAFSSIKDKIAERLSQENKEKGVIAKRHTLELLKDEYKIQKFLYENGVNVPHPKGVFKVNLETILERPTLGFVMEYIKNGQLISKVEDSNERIKAERYAERELKKAKALGVHRHKKDEKYNIMWDGKKAYLIDFGKGIVGNMTHSPH